MEFNDVFSLLLELNLSSAPSDIVERIWKGEQLETDQDYIEAHVGSLRKGFLESLLQKLTSIKHQTQISFWSFIAERQLSHKTIFVWLQQIIEKRNTQGFIAAECFLKLFHLPGSSAYPIFNPIIFRTILMVLKEWQVAHLVQYENQLIEEKTQKRNKRKGIANKSTNKKKNPKRTKVTESKNKGQHSEEEEEEEVVVEDVDEEMEESNTNDGPSPKHKKNDYGEELTSVPYENYIQLLMQLKEWVDEFPIDKHSTEVKNTIIEIVVELTRLDYDNIFANKKTNNRNNKMKHGNEIAYNILLSLLHPTNGDIIETATTIIKNIITNLIMNYGSNGTTVVVPSSTIPKWKINVRNQAIEFIKKIDKENDKMYEPLHALVQHICMRTPDKADYRNYSVNTIVLITKNWIPTQQTRFFKFLQRFAKNAKSSFRLFAVETACAFICNINDSDDAIDEVSIIHPLLQIIIQRSSDKIATVRAKSLTSLANIFELVNTNNTLKFEIKNCLQGTEDQIELMNLIRKRIKDDKVGVRKASLQVFQVLCELTITIDESDICLLMERCVDNSVLIRKQAMTCLTEYLIKTPKITTIQTAWIHGVLPLITDPESTVHDKLIDYFDSLIFQKIINEDDDSCWDLLNNMVGESLKYVSIIINKMIKDKRINKSIIKKLEKNIENTNINKGSYLLLSELSNSFANTISHKIIVKEWYKYKESTKEEDIFIQQRLLMILESVAIQISMKQSIELTDELIYKLNEFKCPVLLIQSIIRTVVRLTSILIENNNNDDDDDDISIDVNKYQLNTWCTPLYLECDKQLSNVILPMTSITTINSSINDNDNSSTINNNNNSNNSNKGTINDEQTIKYLFTIGELVQINSGNMPKRLSTVIQSIITEE